MMNQWIYYGKTAWDYGLELLRYLVMTPVARLLYRGKGIWLISERGHDARDNGYVFFDYLRREHRDVPAYYVADPESPDYEKVKDHGVPYRSLRHYLLFLGADYKISTHIMGCSPNLRFYLRFPRLPLYGKQIFLQHGILNADLPFLHGDKRNLSLFVSGAEPEYRMICEKFGYPAGVVQYTGLARFDRLQNGPLRRQILVMPTWRGYVHSLSNGDLANTDYIRRWNSFLRNPGLTAFLERKDLQLVFYPHYELQSHLDLFDSGASRVLIASRENWDVSDLLKESRLLVTDYSSVFYDFAYLGKPVVYYQFDRGEFCAPGTGREGISYEQTGFGPVCLDELQVLDCLEQAADRGFAMEQKYMDRVCRFFPRRDTHNCDRIFERIQAL